jgi:three-Cys-motif partner protein
MTNPDYLQPVDDGLPMREAGVWAAEKLDYLERYIHVFETSMRDKKWRRRYYIDLFAGPGKNRLDDAQGTVVLGSPLIALTTAHPFTDYFFVEKNKEYADALRTRCSASALVNPDEDILVSDCNKAIDTIIGEIARRDCQYLAGQWPCLNLAFIDPEGLQLEWQTVEKLAGMERMDLIINFPIMALRRNLRGFSRVKPPTPTPADRFFGGPEWRDVYGQYQSRPVFLSRLLLDLYKQKLVNLGYKDVILGEETGDEVLIRSARRRAPLYYLVFASKHPLGKEFWRSISSRDVRGQRRMF